MKKTLILAGISTFLLSSTMAFATTVPETAQPAKCTQGAKMQSPKRPNIDERLKLTEEQKTQAHAIRMKGHEKIKPVIDQIKAKRQEADAVKRSRIAVQEQEKRLAAIKTDIKKLKEEARAIRQENTKEFEAILTPEQKTEFAKIKAEGREKFKKHKKEMGKSGHHGRPNASEPQNK